MSARGSLLILLLGVCVSLGAGCKHDDPEAANPSGKVQTRAAAKQLRQAQTRAMRRSSDLQAQLTLGKVAYEQGYYNDAYRGYQQAVTLEPENPEAVVGMARTNLKLHEPVQGLDWVQRAQKLKPQDPELIELRARMHLLSGQSDQAIASFRRAVAMQPGRASTLLNLASAYSLLNRDAEAVATARQAVRSAPDRPTTHYALGLFLTRTGERRAAEGAFRQALKLDAKHAPSMIALADALVAQRRNLEEARQLAVRASQIQSDRSEGAVLAAWILHLQGDDRAAATDLIKIVNTIPQDPEAWQKLAIILRRIGKPQEAERADQMARQFIPRRPRLAHELENG